MRGSDSLRSRCSDGGAKGSLTRAGVAGARVRLRMELHREQEGQPARLLQFHRLDDPVGAFRHHAQRIGHPADALMVRQAGIFMQRLDRQHARNKCLGRT